ncbi:hypothetical protein ACXC9Q_08535 [Kribbella sp. CWNU-51]
MVGLRELWNDAVPDAGALADDLLGRYAGMSRHVYRDRYVVSPRPSCDRGVVAAGDLILVGSDHSLTALR